MPASEPLTKLRVTENFPTIEVRRGEEKLFYGTLLPKPEILESLLKTIL